MPSKKVKFQTDEYYHVYNRGVDKRDIFSDIFDFQRFLESLREFNTIEPIGSLKELKERRNLPNGGRTPVA